MHVQYWWSLSAPNNIRDVIEISCLLFVFSVKMGFGIHVKEVFFGVFSQVYSEKQLKDIKILLTL